MIATILRLKLNVIARLSPLKSNEGGKAINFTFWSSSSSPFF